jgi:hypothetical protein
MQHVNDDMDELFRRAAENYPLDTSSADWNKVLAGMQEQDGSQTVPGKESDKKRHFLWLLLLLPLGFLCNQLYTPGNLKEKNIAEKNVAETGTPKNNKPEEKQIGQSDKNQKSESTNADKGVTITKAVERPNAKLSAGKDLNSVTSNQKAFLQPHYEKRKKNLSTRGINNSEAVVKISVTSSKERQSAVNNYSVDENFFSRQYVSQILFARTREQKKINLEGINFSSVKNPYEQSSKAKLDAGRRQKKFYAGAIVGLDATTIKFQKIEKKGYDYGLLLGYQLNKKWAVETGLYMANKYYYTDGKYIDVSKVYPNRPNWWIEDASGDCRMIEVPVSVKYNFSSGKKSSWFSTLGTSSYFMKEEKYIYETYYGTSGPWLHDYKYKNASTNLFSNISISGGYNHKIGNIGDLRIEPYLKIPVSKTGTANLPLLSTGIHVGVIKRF